MIPAVRHRFAGALAACLLAFAGLAPSTAAVADPTALESPSRQYIVVLREAPLARYAGGTAGIPAPASLPGRSRLDVSSPSARQYVDYLRSRQQATEATIARNIGRPLAVTMRVQHALNAIVTTLSAAEAEAIRRLPEVLVVDPVRDLPLDTDAGPALIGAPAIWAGTGPAALAPAQGEGTVIGVIDSGVNFGSPSFAAVDPIDGYTHTNPLGAGNYLGTCAAGGDDAGRCNAKLIGGYDFVCGAPVNACTNAALREEPGFGDTDSHGSHTASTSAGNRRDVVVSGATRRIQGVAPRANLIAYDACYVEIASGRGLCPSTATVSAVNQAVADGIVDVINFSIGGGADPWTDATSLAFLGATSAGIYVATSAGNSGPGANTMGHHEPWTSSTAAAQHGRQGFSITMGVTGPTPVPANLTTLVPSLGTGGVNFAAPIPGTTPLRISAGIDTASDGCAAFPANTFAGAIAVIRRGTCSFSIKVNNASAAGAIAVIIANNQAGILSPSVPGTTVPVFAVTQAEGDALRNFGQANPATATAQINFPASVIPNLADQLAAFSSRGPAGNYDLVKPDVTAPGVNVLAAIAGTALTGSENAAGLLSGTSMASPHNAGSALLLRQLRPTWTPLEIKSALSMTTTRAVVKEDGVTSATPFDMGAGRIRVDRASNAGLVMNETTDNFTNANPATGGAPASLNLPSLGKRACVGECQFVRTFRSTRATATTWNAAVTGLAGSVSPSSFTVPAGGSVTVTITIDSSAIPPDGTYRFGWVELSPQGGPADDLLTMPVAVSVPPPVVGVNPSNSVTVGAGAIGSVTIAVANNGSFPLDYSVQPTGTGLATAYYADNTGIASGFRNTVYTDPATAGSQAQFAADDFVVSMNTTLRTIAVQGFVVSGAALTAAATNLTWSIYPDAGGVPAGNPQTNPAAAVWTYTSTPTGAGVTTVGSSEIRLDLAAAGQNVSLPPGRYWLLVNTRGTFANRFAQYGSNTGSGGFASITIATNGTGAWATNNSFPGLTMQVTGAVPCGAPWIGSATPSSGTVAGSASQNVVFPLSATDLAPGNYLANACFATNDAATPSVASAIRLTVAPTQLAFTTAPGTSAAANVPFAQQPVVTAQDAGNATVTGYALPVTLSLASGTGTLTCDTNPVQPVNGVAAFTGCRIDALGSYTLRASTSGIADATTNPAVTVTAGAASRLAFASQPGGGEAAAPWVTQPSVTVQDAFGNPVLDATNAVTLAITTPDGAILTCAANPAAAAGGTAAFTGCAIDKTGTYTLTATSPGLVAATSASFGISSGPPAKLAFSTQPGGGPAGAAWNAQPVVSVLDAGGNRIAAATNAVTLAVATPAAGPLACAANPVNAASGFAVFAGCAIATPGSYTLSAAAAGLAGATSASFAIGKLDQAITFGALADRYAGSADFTVSATASSGLAVAFASDTAATCTVTGTTVRLVAEGTCTLRATQPGDATYNAAAPVTQSFAIRPATEFPRLVNVSTRGAVLTGENVMIAGFIVGGTQPKTVLVRGRGSSLIPAGVAGVIVDPRLTLVNQAGTVLAANDNWNVAANAAAIVATGKAPSDSLEPAILMTLPPGAYTAILHGTNGSTGVGIVEVFEQDGPEAPLVNLSTRGPVASGEQVLIGGFIVQGSGPRTVLIRARGPSLTAAGVASALADPQLVLIDQATRAVIATNDNWGDAANAAAITATGGAPADNREAAILVTLNPGAYTIIVSGVGGATGVGIVEVFAQ